MLLDELANDYYHRVSIGPHEARVETLGYSDTVLHLPVIEWLASRCQHCTEFGVREANSTVALLRGCRGEVHSYDIERTPMVARLFYKRDELPCKWVFHQGDTGSPDTRVDPTDLLFVDTAHTYEHVANELRWHGRQARRYLLFHDTLSCGIKDLTGPDPARRGIIPAIQEWLRQFPGEYQVIYDTPWSNGMVVLERLYPARRVLHLPFWELGQGW